MLRYVPVGVGVGIVPWNFPMLLGGIKIVSALAAFVEFVEFVRNLKSSGPGNAEAVLGPSQNSMQHTISGCNTSLDGIL